MEKNFTKARKAVKILGTKKKTIFNTKVRSYSCDFNSYSYSQNNHSVFFLSSPSNMENSPHPSNIKVSDQSLNKSISVHSRLSQTSSD